MIRIAVQDSVKAHSEAAIARLLARVAIDAARSHLNKVAESIDDPAWSDVAAADLLDEAAALLELGAAA